MIGLLRILRDLSSLLLHSSAGVRTLVDNYPYHWLAGRNRSIPCDNHPHGTEERREEKRRMVRLTHVWMAASGIPSFPSNAARCDMASTSVQAPPFNADLPSSMASSKSCLMKTPAVSIGRWKDRVREGGQTRMSRLLPGFRVKFGGRRAR